jgi:hypothetical protein
LRLHTSSPASLTAGALAALLAAASLPSLAAGPELIVNGDFSQTYDPVGWASSLPTGWTGLSGNTDNAGVFGGAMLFSTAGVHNATTHRYYIYQSFDAGNGGDFTLRFDYLLQNAYNGALLNGAKVVIDEWYAPSPNIVFSATYMAEGYTSAWHLGQTVPLSLSPGLHQLWIGTLGASSQNDQASVYYDNVSLTANVPEPASAWLLLAGLSGLPFLRRRFAQLRARSQAARAPASPEVEWPI